MINREDLAELWRNTPHVKAALRYRWARDYLSCAYCGKVLAWRWKIFHGFGFSHRLHLGPCQCERIGGPPKVQICA